MGARYHAVRDPVAWFEVVHSWADVFHHASRLHPHRHRHLDEWVVTLTHADIDVVEPEHRMSERDLAGARRRYFDFV